MLKKFWTINCLILISECLNVLVYIFIFHLLSLSISRYNFSWSPCSHTHSLLLAFCLQRKTKNHKHTNTHTLTLSVTYIVAHFSQVTTVFMIMVLSLFLSFSWFLQGRLTPIDTQFSSILNPINSSYPSSIYIRLNQSGLLCIRLTFFDYHTADLLRHLL